MKPRPKPPKRRTEHRPEPSPALNVKLTGAWVHMRLEMLQSAAWTALSDASRRAIDRLLIEHLRRGRLHNGALICTYHDFVEAGIRRGSIRLALLCAGELGFVEITRQGFAARMDIRVPSQYRITFLPGRDGSEPSDEWRNICTPADARAAIRRARTEQEEANEVRRRSPERGTSLGRAG